MEYGWLAEVVRPKKAPVPWPAMARAALAIWTASGQPLAAEQELTHAH